MDVYRIVCVWQRARCLQPVDAIRQWTEWPPWLLMELSQSCKTIAGMEQVKYPSMSSFSTTHHHLPLHRILPLNQRGTPVTNWRAASYPHFTKQGEISILATVTNQMKPRHEGMPKQKWGVAPNSLDCDKTVAEIFIFMALFLINLWTVIRQLLKFLIGLYSSSSLHVDIIILILLFYICMAWKWTQMADQCFKLSFIISLQK